MFAITSAPPSQVGALANVDVRQAIAYAMPYNTILNNILFGRGTRDYSIVSPTAPEYTPAWSMYTTDLAKAKSLMKAAGNPTINEPLYYLKLRRRPNQHSHPDPGEPEEHRHHDHPYPRDPGGAVRCGRRPLHAREWS